MKWPLSSSAALFIATMGLLWAAACGDESTPSPSPSASTSPQPTQATSPTPTIEPSLATFIGTVSRDLAERSVSKISDLTNFTDITCETGIFEPPVTCAAGDAVPAIHVAVLQSQGFDLPQVSFGAFWSEYIDNLAGADDENGPPTARVMGAGTRQPLGTETPPDATIALSKISGASPSPQLVPGSANSRQLLLLDLKSDAAGWKITQMVVAPIMDSLDTTLADLFAQYQPVGS